MSKIVKAFLFTSIVLALVVPLSLSSAQSSEAAKYTVLKDGSEIASLSILSNRGATKITVERSGQVPNVYTKSLKTNEISVERAGQKILVYNNTSGDFQFPDSKNNVKNINWAENKFTAKSLDIQNQLSEDMSIFRIVRNFDNSVKTRSFELAYVILTSDESKFWMNDFKNYEVKSSNSVKGLKQTASIATESSCGEGCDSRLASCLQSVPVGDRIECFRIADNCHARCDAPPPSETSKPIEP